MANNGRVVDAHRAAVGLWRDTRWEIRLAVIILSVDIVGDLLDALVRHDYRALIGLPIGGAMIVYLLRARPSSSPDATDS
ncbi:MAG: hypothetical protein QOH88_1649 [Verrucomicrobiota bacterium]